MPNPSYGRLANRPSPVRPPTNDQLTGLGLPRVRATLAVEADPLAGTHLARQQCMAELNTHGVGMGGGGEL